MPDHAALFHTEDPPTLDTTAESSVRRDLCTPAVINLHVR
jgi:hypothetical protein